MIYPFLMFDDLLKILTLKLKLSEEEFQFFLLD